MTATPRDLTVVDAAGPGSLNAASTTTRAQAVLGIPAPDNSSVTAQAVLYVVNQAVRADDAEQLGLVGRPRAEPVYHAMAQAGWWPSFASFGATPARSRVAHGVHRAYFLLWQQLRKERGAGVRSG